MDAISLQKEAVCDSYFSEEANQWSCEPVTSPSHCLQAFREPGSFSGCSLGLAALFKHTFGIELA